MHVLVGPHELKARAVGVRVPHERARVLFQEATLKVREAYRSENMTSHAVPPRVGRPHCHRAGLHGEAEREVPGGLRGGRGRGIPPAAGDAARVLEGAPARVGGTVRGRPRRRCAGLAVRVRRQAVRGVLAAWTSSWRASCSRSGGCGGRRGVGPARPAGARRCTGSAARWCEAWARGCEVRKGARRRLGRGAGGSYEEDETARQDGHRPDRPSGGCRRAQRGVERLHPARAGRAGNAGEGPHPVLRNGRGLGVHGHEPRPHRHPTPTGRTTSRASTAPSPARASPRSSSATPTTSSATRTSSHARRRRHPTPTNRTPSGNSMPAPLPRSTASETYDGQEVFPLCGAHLLEESCLDCHGGPAGELDVTGYPKEGMAVGDLIGVTSIIMPIDIYMAGIQDNVTRQVGYFSFVIVMIILAVYALITRLITRPLTEVESAVDQMENGNFESTSRASRATAKSRDLAVKVRRHGRTAADPVRQPGRTGEAATRRSWNRPTTCLRNSAASLPR